MTASIEHRLGYMLEELRRIRMAYQFDRADFRRLKTIAMRRLAMTITRSEMTPEAIEELITQRVAEAFAEQEANRNLEPIVGSESENGGDNGNGNGGGNRNGNGGGNGNNGNNNGVGHPIITLLH
ncbi:hypothetical protein Tco_1074352 [Tanacetum coccineum]